MNRSVLTIDHMPACKQYLLQTELQSFCTKHWVIFRISPRIIPSFPLMLDLILGLIRKKVMLEFSIILILNAIVSDTEFHTDHQTDLQLHSEVNLNNPEL